MILQFRPLILATGIALGLLTTVTGCGKEVADNTKHTRTEKQVQKAPLKERKAAFQTKLEALGTIGFDVNQTGEEAGKTMYLLQVRDAQKAAMGFLGMLHMATLDQRSQRALTKMLKGTRIGLEVAWQKYADNAENSVFVYFLGNGRESAALQELIKEKKLGAYLSFDAKERVKKAAFKEFDEKIIAGSETIHLLLKGARIDIAQAPTATSPQRVMTLKGGTFAYEVEHNGSREFAFSYQDPLCKINKKNAYLGRQVCSFPQVQIDAAAGRDSMSVQFKKSSLDYESRLHDTKIRSDLHFQIADIVIQARDSGDDIDASLKHLDIKGFSDGIDEAVIKAFYQLASQPSADANQTALHTMKLVGELFSQGMVLDYTIGVDRAEGKSVSAKKSTAFLLESYRGAAQAHFGKTLSYQEKSTVKSIMLKEQNATEPLFKMENLRFGYGVKEMHNFLPAFMEFALLASQRADQSAALSKEEQTKLSAMGMRIVNDGFGLSLAPVGLDSIRFEERGKQQQYGKMDLSIDARLLPNTVKLNSPASAMLLLSFLQADGKLVLSRSDLERMSNSFSPQMMAMVMMYAKYEGDQAVFELKFEKGHLMVNGKPVM